MDETVSEREVVAATDGVTLRKSYEGAGHELPAVTYEFTSNRDEAVTVTVVERVPDALTAEQIGFLDARAEGAWRFEGPRMVFEAELGPNAYRKTACGARGENATAIDALVAQPTAFEVSAASATDEPAVDDGATAAAATGSVVDRFVEDLRAGDVSTENRRFLEAEFGADSPARSVDARLQQLQTDVADVRAYTNALETFLDEHGSGRAVIDRVETQFERLAASVDSVDDAVDANDAELDALREDVDALAVEVRSTRDELATLSERVDSLAPSIEAVESSLPAYDVGDRISLIESELDEVAGFTDSLRAAFRD